MTDSVAFPEGQTGSSLFRSALASAVDAHPTAFDGLTVPAVGAAFKRALPEWIVQFEARRAAHDERVAIARHLADHLAQRTLFGEQPLAAALEAPTEAPALQTIAGTAAVGWVPRITWQGRTYEGADIGHLVDRLQQTCQLTEAAATALRWTVDTLLGEPVDLSGHRFAILGAAAELAPTPYLLAAGAQVLWVDRQTPELLDPSAFAGQVHHHASLADLLTDTPAVAASVGQLAAEGPLHLGLYAYAPGRGRELLLTAAMNAVAATVQPASVAMLVSPTTPGEVQASCRADLATRRGASPLWQSALAKVGVLREPAFESQGDVAVSRAVVPLQGPTYLAAQYLTKMMVAEAWCVDRAPARISANVAGITHTKSLEHPLFLAGFLGAPAFGIQVFEPEQTRVLTTLMLLHDLLADTAPCSATAPADEGRARRVVAQSIHGGVRSAPFVLDNTIRVAALLGLARRPGLLVKLVTG